jgi:hypothetical protein
MFHFLAQIKEITANTKYICPLHVGACEKGILTKFIDFAGSLYPETLLPKGSKDKEVPPQSAVGNEPQEEGAAADIEEELAAPVHSEIDATATKEIVAEEEPQSVDISVCAMCTEKLSLQPAGTWGNGWSCDWPGHEGSNFFQSDDPLYGCPTIAACDWGVCQTCWDMIRATQEAQQETEKEDEDWDICDQPEGTRSSYSKSYYCDVPRIAFKASDDETSFFTCVSYSVRGDLSLGPLQDPSSSRLVVDGRKIVPCGVKVYIRDAFQIQGELLFETPMSDLEAFVTKPVGFIFGSSGFSTAKLIVPNSQEVLECNFPHCTNGHVMVISDYNEGGYRAGYECNTCCAVKRGLRWLCKDCTDDFCFSCEPVQPMQPTCGKNSEHILERRTTNPKEYRGSARCDKCRRTNLAQDPEFYHCKDGCEYDFCLKCATEQIAKAAASPVVFSDLVEALFDIKVEDEDELNFSAGDIIEVIGKVNDDWWLGRCHGKEGLFPTNYVKQF